jgi:hypothetical protein
MVNRSPFYLNNKKEFQDIKSTIIVCIIEGRFTTEILNN